MKPIKKQRKWQLKMKKQNLCQRCGEEPAINKSLGRLCSIKRRLYQRKKLGLKAKVQGKAGRPTIY